MFGLPQATIDLLRDYFLHIPKIEKVVIYGSRAKGKFEQGSDIDFAFSAVLKKISPDNFLWSWMNYPPHIFSV